ncbi:MAG: M1 family aminopeptidase, partial [Hyphomonas sp.]
HQWFGNLVTPKWWNDIWLNEAFATWMASKTMHAVDPGGAWDLNPVAGGLDAMGSDSLLSARAVRNPVTRNGDINDAFDAITYQKGGSVLSMFETYLGEDRFRDGIRVHMRRFADGVADADDFMASLAEGAGDTAVAGSFRSFIEQPGIPMLDVQVTCTDGGAEMTVSQSRYAPLGSEIDRQAASWQVPFSARTGEKGVVQKLLTGKVQTLGDLPGCPDFVMPNAGGTGYWRYSLDEDWSAKLAANYDKLTAGEQMAFVDSLIAGFHAGAVSAADLLAGLEASTGGAPMAAGLPFAALKAYHARLDADGQAALAAWIEATYAPLERWLAARREADLTDQEKLLKDSLGNLLAEYGDRPAVRAKMVANAKAKIGLGQAANAAALPAQDVGTAFGLAAAQDGADFIVPALDYAFASDDQTLRASIFRALVSHAPPQMAADMVRNAPNLPYTSSEQSTVLGGAFANVAAIDAVWPAFKASFAEITAKMPEARKQQLAAYAGSHCSAAGAADAKAFFESKAAESPGHDRRLAQGLEQAALCTARADRLIPDLTAALSAR